VPQKGGEIKRSKSAKKNTEIKDQNPSVRESRLMKEKRHNTRLKGVTTTTFGDHKMKYDYYEINLPGDLCENNDDWLENMGSYAISEARERAALYVIPAEWTAELIEGDADSFEVIFKVRRKRNQ
jgi:hypothetical protein